MKLGKLQRNILARLYNAAEVKPTSRYYPHAASYAYTIYEARVAGTKIVTLSRSVKMLTYAGFIVREHVGIEHKFYIDDRVKRVKPALLDQWQVKQEILYLTEEGISLVESWKC